MGQLQALWAQFGAVHPVYSHMAVLFVGMVAGPQLVKWAESKLPSIIDKLDEHQEILLRRAGLTTEQLIAVREHEVKNLRASADALEARNTQEKLELSAKATEAPKTGVQATPPAGG